MRGRQAETAAAPHRIAHLRALIGLQPEGCGRRDELSELLREEIADASIE
jgi:hypothetical protein